MPGYQEVADARATEITSGLSQSRRTTATAADVRLWAPDRRNAVESVCTAASAPTVASSRSISWLGL